MGGALVTNSHSRTWPLMVPSTILLAVVLSLTAARAMCPPQCRCQDDALVATCTSAKLAVFPIQLNPDVRHIDLSDNKISSVDYTLTFYINLLHLDLSHNKIHSLGTHNFDRQENLTFLNISFNQITHLGKGTFKGLKVLKLLDLSNNSIELVDVSALKDTVELEVLNLMNNKITSFEDPLVFKNLRKLKVLYLDGNQILDVPSQVLKNLPYSSIEVLTLSNNYIDIIDELSFPSPVMGSLKTLSLASNAVSNVHRSSFNSLHSLTILDISDNNLTVVPTEQLAKLSQLVELDLSNNMFTELSAVAFQSLFHLKILCLSRMPRLERIDSRAFVDNIHLETVIMDDNREVKILPARIFHGNLHLRYISIRKNSLSVVDASHFPLDSLESLDLSENPLECNCSLLWLWKLARQKAAQGNTLPSNDTMTEEDRLLHLSTARLRCAAPPALRGSLLVDAPDSAVRCETAWITVAAVTGFVLALFVATCTVLLLIGERPLLACRRSKDPVPLRGDSKHATPSLHTTPPVLMLMPEKHFPPDPTTLHYAETWVPLKSDHLDFPPVHNDYVTNSLRKPAHVVYV